MIKTQSTQEESSSYTLLVEIWLECCNFLTDALEKIFYQHATNNKHYSN
jgi:hypothetical protein